MATIRQQPEIIGYPNKVTEKPRQDMSCIRQQPEIIGYPNKVTEKPHQIMGHLRKEIGPTKLVMTREMIMDMYSNAIAQWLRASGFTKSTIPKILQKTCDGLEKPSKKRIFPSKVKGHQTATGLHIIDTVLHKNPEGEWVTKEKTMKAYSIDGDYGEEIRFEFPMM